MVNKGLEGVRAGLFKIILAARFCIRVSLWEQSFLFPQIKQQ